MHRSNSVWCPNMMLTSWSVSLSSIFLEPHVVDSDLISVSVPALVQSTSTQNTVQGEEDIWPFGSKWFFSVLKKSCICNVFLARGIPDTGGFHEILSSAWIYLFTLHPLGLHWGRPGLVTCMSPKQMLQLALGLPAHPRDAWKSHSCSLHVVSYIILGVPVPHSSALVEFDWLLLVFRPPTTFSFPARESSRAHLAAIMINNPGAFIPYFSSDHLLPLPMPEVAGNPPAISAHRCALFGRDSTWNVLSSCQCLKIIKFIWKSKIFIYLEKLEDLAKPGVVFTWQQSAGTE